MKAEGVESLYPFLYAVENDLESVLTEVRRSTVEKATEIVALRRRLAEEQGERLAACAAEMAARFDAGGRRVALGQRGGRPAARRRAPPLPPPPQGPALPACCLCGGVARAPGL